MSKDDGAVFVFNKTKQTFLAYRVKVADTILTRLIGLLGKRSLDADSGLWIFPSRGIHTLGMMFDIDVVFLDKDYKVVGVHEVIHPFSMTGLYLNAESALELPPHTIFKTRTSVGDEMMITRIEDLPEVQAEIEQKPAAEPTGVKG
jgi:hypothetical protein